MKSISTVTAKTIVDVIEEKILEAEIVGENNKNNKNNKDIDFNINEKEVIYILEKFKKKGMDYFKKY